MQIEIEAAERAKVTVQEAIKKLQSDLANIKQKLNADEFEFLLSDLINREISRRWESVSHESP